MKSKILIINITALLIILAVLTILLTGCEFSNMQVMDTTFKFDRAIIFLPNGEKIEGSVDGWLDFENSDMIQVKINDVTYLTHSTNVILISE